LTSIELLTPPSSITGQQLRATRGSNTRGVNCLIALVMLGFGFAHVIGANILSRSDSLDRSPSAIAPVHTD
jgi:hypothetical protein